MLRGSEVGGSLEGRLGGRWWGIRCMESVGAEGIGVKWQSDGIAAHSPKCQHVPNPTHHAQAHYTLTLTLTLDLLPALTLTLILILSLTLCLTRSQLASTSLHNGVYMALLRHVWEETGEGVRREVPALRISLTTSGEQLKELRRSRCRILRSRDREETHLFLAPPPSLFLLPPSLFPPS